MLLSIADSGSLAPIAALPQATRRQLPARAVLPRVPGGLRSLYVESGALAVTCQDPDGGLIIAEVLGVGACCSDHDRALELLGPDWALTTLVPSVIIRVATRTLGERLLVDPSLAMTITTARARQFAAALERQHTLRERTPARRTAGTLLYLAGQMAIPWQGTGLRIPMSQRLIASVAALTRQTLNRELRVLERAGLVHLERSAVCLISPAALERRYQERPAAASSREEEAEEMLVGAGSSGGI